MLVGMGKTSGGSELLLLLVGMGKTSGRSELLLLLVGMGKTSGGSELLGRGDAVLLIGLYYDTDGAIGWNDK